MASNGLPGRVLAEHLLGRPRETLVPGLKRGSVGSYTSRVP